MSFILNNFVYICEKKDMGIIIIFIILIVIGGFTKFIEEFFLFISFFVILPLMIAVIGAISSRVDYNSDYMKLDERKEYLNVNPSEIKNKAKKFNSITIHDMVNTSEDDEVFKYEKKDILVKDLYFKKGKENKLIVEKYRLTSLGKLLYLPPQIFVEKNIIEYKPD